MTGLTISLLSDRSRRSPPLAASQVPRRHPIKARTKPDRQSAEDRFGEDPECVAPRLRGGSLTNAAPQPRKRPPPGHFLGEEKPQNKLKSKATSTL
jgi:hypothetical protein